MISVGDLIDRGPKNVECLKLLEAPWFHAIKGNHEELMQDWFQGGVSKEWWMPNGGKWIHDEDIKEIHNRFLPLINELPLLITVEGPKKFHVLHAEFDESEPITDADLANEDKVREMCLVQCLDGATGIWGRHLFMDMYAQLDVDPKVIKWLEGSTLMNMFNDDLSVIFCGHTPVTKPTRIGGMINLDTMAFSVNRRPWCGLSFAEPATGKFWTVKDDIEEVELRVIV